jgi:hypothetical protein
VGGGELVRAAVEEVYAALDLEVDTTTAGSLDEVLPGVTTDAVGAAVREAYEAGEPGQLDGALYDAARALAPRHRAD